MVHLNPLKLLKKVSSKGSVHRKNPFRKSVHGKEKKLLGKKNRRGQTEMLGLVIIVILIVIGALFYVRFGILGKKPAEQHRESVIGSIQAYNLLNAIMNIELCEGSSIREGIAKCKKNEELCSEADSCKYLEEEIDSIVKMAIYRDYSLNISSSDGWNSVFGKDCKFGVTSYRYVYNLKGESYSAFFKICQS